MDKMTEDNVYANVPVKPGKNKDSTEMDKMTEDNVYANVSVTPGKNKGTLTQNKAKRGSKVTVKRVVLLVVSLVIVAAVTAIIVVVVYYNTQTKGQTEETERTTIIPHTSPSQPVSTYGSPAVTTSKNPPQCDEDWELHGEKCYFFSSGKLSWSESKKKCQELKGTLVKIDSREEQTFLGGKVQKLMNDDEDKFWIGLTDSETEGEWLWTDGSRLNTNLAFWAQKHNGPEPDNWTEEDPKGEDCVRMGHKLRSGILNWFDKSCPKEHRSICEKTL